VAIFEARRRRADRLAVKARMGSRRVAFMGSPSRDRREDRRDAHGPQMRWLAAALASSALTLLACNASPPPAEPGGGPAVCAPAAIPASEEAGRTGVTTRGGAPLTLLGPNLEVGATAPDAELFDAELKPLRLTDLKGKVIVLSVVPSLDTSVCEHQTGQIAGRQADLPPDVAVLTISRDLPFAQKRVLETNGFKTKAVSDYREGSFGRAFGVLVKENRLLARSVWVIDRKFRVAYRELVADQKNEPSYEPLMAAVKRTLDAP
jgi:thiol peroxidase